MSKHTTKLREIMKTFITSLMIGMGLGLTMLLYTKGLYWWAIIPLVIFGIGLDLRYEERL